MAAKKMKLLRILLKNGGNMDSILEKFLLNVLDETHDGILSLSVFRKNNIQLTEEVYKVIDSLIDKGVLKERDCEGFAIERVGNTRSRYGEQKFFNMYIHLTREQLTEEISKQNNVHGLVILIMDDIGSCIHSKNVSSKDEGIQYFNKMYDSEYRYAFIIL